MKKTHFICIIAFCVLPFYAKGQSSVGVKADINLSNMWITKSTNIKTNMKAGGSAGFFYKYKWREFRAVQADMFFRYRTSEVINQVTGETADYSYFGIEIPVYSLLQAEIDNRIFYVGLGPFASVGLYSRSHSNDRSINLYQKDPTYNKTPIHRWNFGAAFIIGYELKCRLQFNFNYQLGFRNMSGDVFENVDMISQAVCLGAGYRF